MPSVLINVKSGQSTLPLIQALLYNVGTPLLHLIELPK